MGGEGVKSLPVPDELLAALNRAAWRVARGGAGWGGSLPPHDPAVACGARLRVGLARAGARLAAWISAGAAEGLVRILNCSKVQLLFIAVEHSAGLGPCRVEGPAGARRRGEAGRGDPYSPSFLPLQILLSLAPFLPHLVSPRSSSPRRPRGYCWCLGFKLDELIMGSLMCHSNFI